MYTFAVFLLFANYKPVHMNFVYSVSVSPMQGWLCTLAKAKFVILKTSPLLQNEATHWNYFFPSPDNDNMFLN